MCTGVEQCVLNAMEARISLVIREGEVGVVVRPTSTYVTKGEKDPRQSYETPYVTLSHKIPNRKQEMGNKKKKVLQTSTKSISQNSNKSHTRADGKTPRI